MYSDVCELSQALKDDIIDWPNFEPEMDKFCKVSLMEGLKFVIRRNDVYKHELASNIFEKL